MECKSSGLDYAFKEHDVTLKVPERATEAGKKVCLKVGVAMKGPFIFPENTRPISPIVWLSIEHDVELRKPIQLQIPHCMPELTVEKIQGCGIHVNQADHVMDSKLDIQDKRMYYKFLPSQSQGASSFLQKDRYAVVKTKQSGLFCITRIASSDKNELCYCLTRIDLTPSPPNYEFHFYVLLDLATHKNVS